VNRAIKRFVSSLIVAATIVSAPTTVSADEEPTPDAFPLSGTLDVTPGASSVSVTFAYGAPDDATIRGFRLSLSGPSFSGDLFRTNKPATSVSSSVEQSGLSAGTYTLTAWAEIGKGNERTSGMATETVDVGVGIPPPAKAATIPAFVEPAEGSVTAAEGPLEDVSAQVVVYGATPSGVLAAVSAARTGASVALIEPTAHVGGMMSSGLSATDYGHTSTIGGYTDEFFDRVQAIEGSSYGRWRFQPSTAEAVFMTMLNGARVSVYPGEALAESGGVTMNGTRILSLQTTAGRRFTGTVFVDASYEGDLMAQAGVSYVIGRESASAYGESFAGVAAGATVFTAPAGIDPGFPVAAPGPIDSGDGRIQYSNFRLCFSTAANRIPFARPATYDPARYDIVDAYLEWRIARGNTPDLTWFLWPVALTNGKYDVNNNGQVSIGLHGLNVSFPDGSYADRQVVFDELRSYTEGFLYFLRNDPRVPSTIRTQMARYGLCADEFEDTGNWPPLLYLREGRRMVGATVLRERDVLLTRTKPDTIAIASSALDTHHVSRWIDGSSRLRVEGGFWTGRGAATRWSIPYRSLTPRADEATNLLVTVTVSDSHVANASLRMEPQYMMIGEAGGTAAAMAARAAGGAIPVQSVDIARLRTALKSHGAVIDNYLFWDIVSSPFRGDIEATFLRGVTFGCTPITFCPTAITERQVMAAWLARALELPPATRDWFTDDETSPHEDSINRVADAGITRGCATGRFCPTSGVSRGQMAAFLNRAFRLPPTSRDFFTDDDTNIFEGDINELAASGITAGCGGTKFCPSPFVSRDQMSAFLWRGIR
jgi:hypothetical protein